MNEGGLPIVDGWKCVLDGQNLLPRTLSSPDSPCQSVEVTAIWGARLGVGIFLADGFFRRGWCGSLCGGRSYDGFLPVFPYNGAINRGPFASLPRLPMSE